MSAKNGKASSVYLVDDHDIEAADENAVEAFTSDVHGSMPQAASNKSPQNHEVEHTSSLPGAFAEHGDDGTLHDGSMIDAGGETETVMVSAQLVDNAVEEQLRDRIAEMEVERQRMEAERNQIVDAEEVRPERDIRVEEEATDHVEEWKPKMIRWAIAFAVLIVVVIAVVLGVVLTRGGADGTPMATPAPITQTATTLDELVALFSSTNPATATSLQDTTSNQYQAIEWLAKDVEENGFYLTTNEDRILARGALAILFYSTNGNKWNDETGWLEHGVSECDWYGVVCTSTIVTKLDLGWKSSDDSGNNLRGTLPPEIGLLSRLAENLDLSDNSISGTIATEIGLLTNLILFLF